MYNTAHDTDVIDMRVMAAIARFAEPGDDCYRDGYLTGDDLARWSHVATMGEMQILLSGDFTPVDEDDDDDSPVVVGSRRIVLSNKRDCFRLEHRDNDKHRNPHHHGDRVRR